MIWFKCQKDCNLKKDVNEILNHNKIDMIDKRCKNKSYVSIMPDERDMPIY